MTSKTLVVKRGLNLRALVTSQLQGIVTTYLPALAAFLQVKPEWQLAFAGAISLYGIYMAYNQEDINDVVQFINEHPEELSSKIVQTTEFQKGFVTFLERYLRERVKSKKQILKNIFLGYARSEQKEKFELERLDDCVSRISISSLEFLSFFQKEITPRLNEQTIEEVNRSYRKDSDRSMEWWVEQATLQKAVWGEFIDRWLHDNYSTDTEKVRKDYGQELHAGWLPDLLHRAQTRERAKRSEYHEAMSELVTLGVFDIRVTGGTVGSGSGKDYNLTSFGLKFLRYINS